MQRHSRHTMPRVSGTSRFALIHYNIFLRLLLFVSAFSIITASSDGTSQQFFNFEIAKRVEERLEFFLRQPQTVQEIIQNFRTNGMFENDMRAPDRDDLIRTIFGLPESILPSKLAYCGFEDGTNIGWVTWLLIVVVVLVESTKVWRSSGCNY